MAPKSHVAVLQGGWSPEREISLISGQKCAEALQRSGYQVTQIDAVSYTHLTLPTRS